MPFNIVLWLDLVQNVANVVAQKNGVAPRELGLLNLLSDAAKLATLTDADLGALRDKYQQHLDADTETTAQALDDIAARIRARHEKIQAS